MAFTYQDINTLFGADIFSIDSGDLILNCSTATGDSGQSVTDTNFLELIYKLFKIGLANQIEYNKTATTPLTSFSNLFFGTVELGSPSYQNVSCSFSAKIPLQEDTVIGTN